MSLIEADKIYLGSQVVNSVYVGADKTWPVTQAWTPGQVAGLKIWLDAADYTPGSWPNKASGGSPATIVGTPAPTISANTQNGLPLVRFTANEGRLRMNGTTGVNIDFTLAYVGRICGPGTGRVVDSIYPPSNFLFGFWNGYQDVAYCEGFTAPDMRTVWTTPDWKLYSADGVSGLNRFLSDGTLLGSTPTGSGWQNCFAISGYDPTSAAETCDCEIAEVLLYSRKLSDVERQEAEGYLRQKWIPSWGPEEGIYLPSATPATGGSYDGTFSVGNRIQVLAAGRITGIRYWRPSGTPDTRSVDLWTDAGALLAHGMSTGVVGWNTFAITPVAVAAGDIIRVTHGFSGTGDSWPYTNSTLVSASPNLSWLLGVFAPPLPSGAQDDFPSSTTDIYNYFVDVVYQAQL